MNRTLLLTALLLAPLAALHAAEAPKHKANILVILADDLGYGDVRAFNAAGKVPTPQIDRLAREGVRFVDAHTNSAVCSPTRYGLLTGRYAWRSRLTSGVLWGESAPLIEPGRMTIASLLGGRGYHAAAIGKWHLGLGWAALPGDDAEHDHPEPSRMGRLREARRRRTDVGRLRQLLRHPGVARHAPVRLRRQRPRGAPAHGASSRGSVERPRVLPCGRRRAGFPGGGRAWRTDRQGRCARARTGERTRAPVLPLPGIERAPHARDPDVVLNLAALAHDPEGKLDPCQVDYATVRLGQRVRINPGISQQLGKHLNFSLSGTYEQMREDSERLYTAEIAQATVAWHFSARAFLRAIVQYEDYDYNLALYTDDRDQRSRNLFSQFLFSYKLNPQTVLFLGYSDASQGTETYELTRTERSFFIKIGYAWSI